MKAVIIDTVKREVREAEIENSLDAYYRTIGCEYIDVVPFDMDLWEGADPTAPKHDLIVDDEGLINGKWTTGFEHDGRQIAGNAIVAGVNDDDGYFTDCSLSAEEVESKIKFLDFSASGLPEPVIRFIPL